MGHEDDRGHGTEPPWAPSGKPGQDEDEDHGHIEQEHIDGMVHRNVVGEGCEFGECGIVAAERRQEKRPAKDGKQVDRVHDEEGNAPALAEGVCVGCQWNGIHERQCRRWGKRGQPLKAEV